MANPEDFSAWMFDLGTNKSTEIADLELRTLEKELQDQIPPVFMTEIDNMAKFNGDLLDKIEYLKSHLRQNKEGMIPTSILYLNNAFSTAESVLHVATARRLESSTRDRLIEYFIPDFLTTPISLSSSPLQTTLENEYPDISLSNLATDLFGEQVASFNLWELLVTIHGNFEQRVQKTKKEDGSLEARRMLAEPELTVPEYILMTHSLAQLAQEYIPEDSNYDFHYLLLITSLFGSKVFKRNKARSKSRIFAPGKSPGEIKKLQEKHQRFGQLFTNVMQQTVHAIADHDDARHPLAKAYAQHLDSIFKTPPFSGLIMKSVMINSDYNDMPLELWTVRLKKAAMFTNDPWLENLHQRTTEEIEESAFKITELEDLDAMFSEVLEVEDIDEAVDEIFSMIAQYEQLQESHVVFDSSSSDKPPTTASSMIFRFRPEDQAMGIHIYEPYKNEEGLTKTRLAHIIFFRKDQVLTGGLLVASEIKLASPAIKKRILGLTLNILRQQTQSLLERETQLEEPVVTPKLYSNSDYKKGPSQTPPQPHKRRSSAHAGSELNDREEVVGGRGGENQCMQIRIDQEWLEQAVDPSMLKRIQNKLIIINQKLKNGSGPGEVFNRYEGMSNIFGFDLGKKYRALATIEEGRYEIFFIGSHDEYDTELTRLRLG